MDLFSKQEIMDLFFSGLSVGEICKKTGRGTLPVAVVIGAQIKNYKYLSRKVKKQIRKEGNNG